MKGMPPAGRSEARRSRGALEQQVLSCLAVAAGPLTAAQVQAELGSDGSELAYTTIMTTLARLHAKHALTRVADGRAYRYSLTGGTEGAAANVTAHRMLSLLDGANHAEVLSRFVADLTPGDEELLTRLLAKDIPARDVPAGEPDPEGR
jgi:predicted transcriptional regulator